DSLLFGAPRQVRYLTISGRYRNLQTPSKPEIIELERVLMHLSITREQLIDLAILIGTDYNRKVKGIGPKTALKLLKKYQRLEDIPRDLPGNFQDVRELFKNPKVSKDYSIVSKEMNEEKLFEFLCEKKGFDEDRVNHVVERMRKARKREVQKDLFEWF
ncbi:MAG: flap structure-specific endonuclease, partial [Candidatus Methanofastidiosia archaeon]